jgi:hypothetical protein
MSTILVATILVGSVVAICIFLITIHNKHKREAMNQLLNQFSRAGTENNLSFSSQELLNNCVLGLDGVNRKILVVTKQDHDYTSLIIDLNEVKSCMVKKMFGTIKADAYKEGKLEQYLEQIVLHFDLSGKPAVEIVFYKNFENHVYETMELEQKARRWEAILSKMNTALKIA